MIHRLFFLMLIWLFNSSNAFCQPEPAEPPSIEIPAASDERGINNYDVLIVAFTGVLAGVAVIQLLVLASQRKWLSRSVVAAEVSAEASRLSVKTMEDTAQKQLRAYLLIDEAVMSSPSHKMTSLLKIKNTGQTPAFDVVVLHTLTLGHMPLQKALPERNIHDFPPEQISRHDVPSQKWIESRIAFPRELSDEEIRYVMDGKLVMYVHGTIFYRDIFKSDHATKFRLFCGGADAPCSEKVGMFGCHEGNEYS